MTDTPDRPYTLDTLLGIMARLRDPERGCPWDLQQSFRTIAPHTIEEAYEVADAIERDALLDLRDELGDLLFQVVFYAQMAAEQDRFSFDDIVEGICDKMIRRHPHVFADATITSADRQTDAWETQKAMEREARATAEHRTASALDGVARGLPALTRAVKLQKRAARIGFDWPVIDDVLDKVVEEANELKEELHADSDPSAIEDEFGDLLFVLANLSRHLKLDPEAALRRTNAKFERRFAHVEAKLAASGKSPETVTLAELDDYWNEAKSRERA
jgi:MazG family protein